MFNKFPRRKNNNIQNRMSERLGIPKRGDFAMITPGLTRAQGTPHSSQQGTIWGLPASLGLQSGEGVGRDNGVREVFPSATGARKISDAKSGTNHKTYK